MRQRDRYKPYVRRANGREKTESLKTAYALAAKRLSGRPFFVMVQRGWPNLAIEVAASAEELRRRPLAVAYFGWNGWANRLKRYAQGRPEPTEQSCRRWRHKRWDLKRRRLRRKMNGDE